MSRRKLVIVTTVKRDRRTSTRHVQAEIITDPIGTECRTGGQRHHIRIEEVDRLMIVSTTVIVDDVWNAGDGRSDDIIDRQALKKGVDATFTHETTIQHHQREKVS